MPSTMLSESRNDDFWMASGMMERNDARASAPDPPTVYYSVTDESGVTQDLGSLSLPFRLIASRID